MNIIKYKSGNAKLVSTIVIGSLLSETLLNASLNVHFEIPISIREEIRGLYCSNDLTTDIISGLTSEQFRDIDCMEVYAEIFSRDDLRNVLTPEQIAAVDPKYASIMNINKLTGNQLMGVTMQQHSVAIKSKINRKAVRCM